VTGPLADSPFFSLFPFSLSASLGLGESGFSSLSRSKGPSLNMSDPGAGPFFFKFFFLPFPPGDPLVSSFPFLFFHSRHKGPGGTRASGKPSHRGQHFLPTPFPRGTSSFSPFPFSPFLLIFPGDEKTGRGRDGTQGKPRIPPPFLFPPLDLSFFPPRPVGDTNILSGQDQVKTPVSWLWATFFSSSPSPFSVPLKNFLSRFFFPPQKKAGRFRNRRWQFGSSLFPFSFLWLFPPPFPPPPDREPLAELIPGTRRIERSPELSLPPFFQGPFFFFFPSFFRRDVPEQAVPGQIIPSRPVARRAPCSPLGNALFFSPSSLFFPPPLFSAMIVLFGGRIAPPPPFLNRRTFFSPWMGPVSALDLRSSVPNRDQWRTCRFPLARFFFPPSFSPPPSSFFILKSRAA